MSQREPIVAIVGRPNVGKSTLFNRIAQKRQSIVHSQAEITRDRLYAKIGWAGKQFTLIDTGGFMPESQDIIEDAIRKQIESAVIESDLILFVVDSNELITATDREIANLLHKFGKKVITVVNKCDNQQKEENQYLFYELGFEEVFPISALGGRNIGDLLDLILDNLPREVSFTEDKKGELNLAIVGMPNVGKSSIVNALLGEERSIVTDIPGTTRDAVDTELKYYGSSIVLIDTAGLRKKSNIKDNIEYYSNVRAQRAIERCDVAVVIIDAVKGFMNQDMTIIRNVIEKKKGLIIAVNKWDLVEKDSNTMEYYKKSIIDKFKALEYYPIIFVSALMKKRVFRIIEKAREVKENRERRISTSKLNKYFQPIIDRVPPPAVQGKNIKIKYITQVKKEPPVFVFFCNEPKSIKEEYKRFLTNQLRNGFGFEGVPLTLLFREK
jgi:GTP-binding protein